MKVFLFILLVPIFLIFSSPVLAQNPTNSFSPETPQEKVYVGKIEQIHEEGENTYGNTKNPYQIVTVTITSKNKKGEKIKIDHGKLFTVDKELLVRKGEKVVLLSFLRPDGSEEFTIVEKYRLDRLLAITLSFIFLVLALSRLQGLGSIIGLGISILVIVKWIVPQILEGRDPLTTTLMGCVVIMCSTIFLAHGLSKKTATAFGAIVITFVVTGLLSYFFVEFSKLSGLGSDDAYSLQFGLGDLINFKGLFLSGVIIGTLGVLDDITTSLSASVFELAHTEHYKKFSPLFQAGLRIGKEHISSLVNTLVLAYTGSALPLMLFIIINPSQKPLWSILNSEIIAEEIVRSLAGSFSLVIAVPLTVALASFVALRRQKAKK